ncbi:MAG TPA: FHA domain-containing protein, partial [Candidatus Hydrogenedentes bacterium]|nr:FHA domain-containing protein [Candidatus Hydrogenedentota bacterium]
VSTAVGLGLGAVEGLVKRTMRAALIGGLLGAAVGCIGGGLAGGMAQVLYDVLGSVLHADKSFSALVTVRSIGWGLAGMVAGISQGAAMQSVKRVRNGLLGGLIGGLIGGALFDPIVLVLRDDVLSRMVALCAIGTLMGAMIGWIENVLKDAWLHVTAGPLAGKQFVIYRNPTMFGSSPKADIYLFKDPHIEPRHAALHSSGQGSILEDLGTPSGTFVNGERIQRRRLRPGDVVTIGQYAFAYDEKARRKLASPAKT